MGPAPHCCGHVLWHLVGSLSFVLLYHQYLLNWVRGRCGRTFQFSSFDGLPKFYTISVLKSPSGSMRNVVRLRGWAQPCFLMNRPDHGGSSNIPGIPSKPSVKARFLFIPCSLKACKHAIQHAFTFSINKTKLKLCRIPEMACMSDLATSGGIIRSLSCSSMFPLKWRWLAWLKTVAKALTSAASPSLPKLRAFTSSGHMPTRAEAKSGRQRNLTLDEQRKGRSL